MSLECVRLMEMAGEILIIVNVKLVSRQDIDLYYFWYTIGTCENETIVTNRGTFQWPVTPVESLAFLTCPHGPNGASAIRQCRRNGVWETHDTSNCADPRITAEFTSIADVSVYN